MTITYEIEDDTDEVIEIEADDLTEDDE